MWVIPVAVGIGLLIGHARKQNKAKKQYPGWVGVMSNELGHQRQLTFPYLKICDTGEMISEGIDDLGKFSLTGMINPNGTVTMKKISSSSGKITEFDGRIVGPNKIAGVWKIQGEGFGNFQMEMQNARGYQLRRSQFTHVMTDNYRFAYTNDNTRIIGLGVDNIGYYLIKGRLNAKKGKVSMYVRYYNKYDLKVEGQINPLTGDIEGTWKNPTGTKDKCVILAEVPAHPAFNPAFGADRPTAGTSAPTIGYSRHQSYQPAPPAQRPAGALQAFNPNPAPTGHIGYQPVPAYGHPGMAVQTTPFNQPPQGYQQVPDYAPNFSNPNYPNTPFG